MNKLLQFVGLTAAVAVAYILGDRKGYDDGVTVGATQAFLVIIRKQRREQAAKAAQKTEGEAYNNA